VKILVTPRSFAKHEKLKRLSEIASSIRKGRGDGENE
jgi:hypothetical protein